MKQQPVITQFGLSPLAKAGVFVMNMARPAAEGEHDVSAPHRDNHYLLMIATGGQFRLNLDFEALSVAAPAMLFVFPGQVHQVLDVQEPQGWALSFDPSLIDSGFQLLLEKGFTGPLVLDPDTAFYRQAVTLFDLIEQLQTGAADPYSNRSTHALLSALLHLIAGKLVASVPKTKEKRGAVIEQGFAQLLKQHYTTWKQPSQYAAALAISVAHLNDTVKAITGSAVSTHIQQQSILEAKRLLYFTELSVKEIGYELGYDEPVYFGKLFKKVTGLSPLQFRQQFRD